MTPPAQPPSPRRPHKTTSTQQQDARQSPQDPEHEALRLKYELRKTVVNAAKAPLLVLSIAVALRPLAKLVTTIAGKHTNFEITVNVNVTGLDGVLRASKALKALKAS
ncbi:hypothetical protein [Micromonospora endophytica]|uniref:hypothetical protein n=1 Tax=Micromonospora endophytica TaxID=515350 RepID=UPI0011B57733|nr:hypothetical protein [Micromonospora endophytica]BCJ60343.1 hypothetical protein Jiend_37650 [Micromonospora endophytica]